MLSIVLVTYNSGQALGSCLKSLPADAEVIVVDNASSDNSVDVARQAGATVIANAENRGFAAAVNQGAAASTGDPLLILNPDVELVGGLDLLAGYAAATGVLLDPATHLPQTGFSVRRLPTFWTLAFETLGINRLWPGNPVNQRYRCLDLDLSQSQDVEQPAGACLMVRRDVWRQLQGFDESFYPLWFEDVDFCLRLHRAGFLIRFEPGCRLLHSGGHSLERISFTERQLYWYRNLFYYVKKNMGSAAAPGLRALACASACARIVEALLAGRTGQLGAFQAVIVLALTGRGPREKSV